MGEETAAVRPAEEMPKMLKRIIGIITGWLRFVFPTVKTLGRNSYLTLYPLFLCCYRPRVGSVSDWLNESASTRDSRYNRRCVVRLFEKANYEPVGVYF